MYVINPLVKRTLFNLGFLFKPRKILLRVSTSDINIWLIFSSILCLLYACLVFRLSKFRSPALPRLTTQYARGECRRKKEKKRKEKGSKMLHVVCSWKVQEMWIGDAGGVFGLVHKKVAGWWWLVNFVNAGLSHALASFPSDCVLAGQTLLFRHSLKPLVDTFSTNAKKAVPGPVSLRAWRGPFPV